MTCFFEGLLTIMALQLLPPIQNRARAELRRRARAADPAVERPLWTPNPDKGELPNPQRLAVESEADVLGFGGAAGGGKTDLAVGLALTRHHKSIVFRRIYKHLGDVQQRALDLTVGVRVGFNDNKHLLKLDGGRTVEFGAMQQITDWQAYKGRAHDLKSYDEATEFAEIQVRSSMAWNRSPIPGQRCRVIMTFNPPTTTEGQWVIRYFAPWLDPNHHWPAIPGELRWYAIVAGKDIERPDGEPFEHEGETLYPQSRTFLPARLTDNPAHDNADYRATLQATPEPLRSQLLYGDFSASLSDDPWQLCPTAWVEAAMSRWVARDEHSLGRQTCLGVDVAHGGGDQTVIAARYGDWFAPILAYPGRETPDGSSAAALVVAQYRRGAIINVDAIGYGASAHERLSEAEPMGYGLAAHAINVGRRSEHHDRSGMFRCANVRAEAYWRLREALDPEGPDRLALPPDPELKADLTAGVYRITPAGIRIEDKDAIKLRIGRSPDKGDAVALAMLPESDLPTIQAGRDLFAGIRGY